MPFHHRQVQTVAAREAVLALGNRARLLDVGPSDRLDLGTGDEVLGGLAAQEGLEPVPVRVAAARSGKG